MANYKKHIILQPYPSNRLIPYSLWQSYAFACHKLWAGSVFHFPALIFPYDASILAKFIFPCNNLQGVADIQVNHWVEYKGRGCGNDLFMSLLSLFHSALF